MCSSRHEVATQNERIYSPKKLRIEYQEKPVVPRNPSDGAYGGTSPARSNYSSRSTASVSLIPKVLTYETDAAGAPRGEVVA